MRPLGFPVRPTRDEKLWEGKTLQENLMQTQLWQLLLQANQISFTDPAFKYLYPSKSERSHVERSHSVSPGWLAQVRSTAVKLVHADSHVLNQTFFSPWDVNEESWGLGSVPLRSLPEDKVKVFGGGTQSERKNWGETDLDSWYNHAWNRNCCWNL